MLLEKQLKVGIGDMKLTRGEGVIITYALGSCIGLAFYDSYIKLGALLHIMLPEQVNLSDPNVFKYADTGIRETLRKMPRCSKSAETRASETLDSEILKVLKKFFGKREYSWWRKIPAQIMQGP